MISVTESVDTFREEEDLMIGVRGLMIDYYATGVLVNHRREYLGGKARAVSEADWLRHENFYPVIIEKTIWQQVQTRLKQQARPTAGNRAKHRYGFLRECSSFLNDCKTVENTRQTGFSGFGGDSSQTVVMPHR